MSISSFHTCIVTSPPAAPVVLLVDDNPQNLELMETFVSDLPARVFVAHDGVDALEKVLKYRPDLIVLDVMMPRMSGFELCRKLKSDLIRCAIPILMVTALNEPEDREYAYQIGTDDFISKPINKFDFLRRIKGLLNEGPDSGRRRADG